MGIRPEDLYSNRPKHRDGDFHAVDALVEVSETLGNEVILHIDCQGISLVSREASENFTPPDTKIQLFFDIEKIHLFNSENGQAISP